MGTKKVTKKNPEEELYDLSMALESFSMEDAQEEIAATVEPKIPRAFKKHSHWNRWRKFVREYLKNGNNAARAYQVAYNIANYKQAGSSAGHLIKKPEIKALIEKEQDLLARNHEIDIVTNIQLINELIENCIADGDRRHLTKAIDMLNKMGGFYVHTQKLDVNHEGITFNFIRPEEK